jgi:hypothetical protein
MCLGANPVVCASNNPCLSAGACDPATGQCGVGQAPVPNGTSCSDGNACTHGDVCQNGTCTGGMVTNCASSNPCMTGGMCDPVSGGCVAARRQWHAVQRRQRLYANR